MQSKKTQDKLCVLFTLRLASEPESNMDEIPETQ